MIPEDTIASVKTKTDIVALVSESVRLTRRGRSMVGLCPFHAEKTASFHVNPHNNTAHCFGCKWSGSAVDLAMGLMGLTFPEAIHELAGRLGIEVADTRTTEEKRIAQDEARDREDLYRANEIAASFYERCLVGGAAPNVQPHPSSGVARDELARRGVAVPDGTNAASQFRLGYAPPEWDGLAQYMRRNGINLTVAERAGLLVPKQAGAGWYDRFRNRLMFPVADVNGRIIAFSGRALADPAQDARDWRDPPPKYINSPESPIYTKGQHLYGLYQARTAIRTSGEAVLVEGNFDVVSLHARGMAGVVAPLGTAFTEDQARLLRRFTPCVVVLFDGDDAGVKATVLAREPCGAARLDAKVGALPKGSDPDDVARTSGIGALRMVVGKARGYLEWSIDHAIDTAMLDGSIRAKAACLDGIVQTLRDERDDTVREIAKVYAGNRLRRTLFVESSAAAIRKADERLRRLDKAKGTTTRAEPVAGIVGAARGILGALLDFPDLLDDPSVQEALAVAEDDLALAIAVVARNRGAIGAATEEMPAAVRQFVVGRMAAPLLPDVAAARSMLLDNAAIMAEEHASRCDI